MRRLRTVLFWMHLAGGVAAGLVILVMSATGVALAFKPQIQRFVDRDVRIVAPPSPGAPRLGVELMLAKVSEARPDARPASIAMEDDPAASAAVSFGRDATVYVDPYTGRVLGQGSTALQTSFRAMEDWHRWLGGSADNRATRRAITGAANLVFLGLAVSGLYLWWPRQWLPQHVNAILTFRRQATGRARHFNWHNVIGFWCAPVLIVLTASGVVMSYPWANNLVYRLSGSPIPGQVGREGQQAGQVRREGQDGRVRQDGQVGQVGLDRLWARAEEQVPVWRSMTMRLPARLGGPVSFTITDATEWNPFARSQLTLDGRTAAIVSWAPYSGSSLGQKIRGWLRFAHTGELFGLTGQTLAGVASLGGVVLVWTGLSLAIRRLLAWTLRRRTIGERRNSDVAA